MPSTRWSGQTRVAGVLFKLLVLCNYMLGVNSDAPKCTTPLSTNCGCQTDKGLIDLSPLDATPNIAFQDVTGDDQNSYSYNPCSPFTEGDSCNNVAACQSTTFNAYYPLGTQDSVKWGASGDNVQLTYTATDEYGTARTAQVILVCDQTAEGALTAKGEDPQGSVTYTMTLTSKHACPQGGGGGGGGLSPGSILCIVFVVLIFVYLVGGVLVNTLAKGAQGVERIPNISLWKEFPGLVKDGFVFTFCSCRRGSYDNI